MKYNTPKIKKILIILAGIASVALLIVIINFVRSERAISLKSLNTEKFLSQDQDIVMDNQLQETTIVPVKSKSVPSQPNSTAEQEPSLFEDEVPWGQGPSDGVFPPVNFSPPIDEVPWGQGPSQ